MSDRSTRASPVLPTLVLALLLGATILAVQPAEGYPVSSAQADRVRRTFGEGAPFNVWQAKPVTSTFYLHSEEAADPDATFDTVENPHFDAVIPTRVTSVPESYADAHAPLGDYGNMATIGCKPTVDNFCGVGAGGATARFVLAEALDIVDPIQVYGFSSNLWASCAHSGTGAVGAFDPNAGGLFGIDAYLIRQVKDDSGNWIDDPSVGSEGDNTVGHIATAFLEPTFTYDLLGPGSVDWYIGSASPGSFTQRTGPVVSPGQRLVVEYGPFIEDQCIIFWDGDYVFGSPAVPHYSMVKLTTDAQRMVAFAVDDEGQHATGFPAAQSTGAEGRRLTVEALQATAFSPQPEYIQQLKDKHANVRLYSHDAQQYLYYVDNTGGGFPREYNTEVFRLDSSHNLDLVPDPDIEEDIGNGVLRRSYVFRYNEDLPEIKRLEPQFYSYTDGWEVSGGNLAIGGKGISLFVPTSEVTTHTVNPRQPTEFAFGILNTGTQDDVVTVTVSDPGGGWTARIAGGGQFAVAPGKTAVGHLEVVPPATATNGAQRTITLLASSRYDDVPDPDPIAFRTVITNTVSRTAPTITAPDGVVEVSAGRSKAIPVTIRNTGTSADSFVVLASLPANVQGWTVTSTPASLQVPAASTASILIQVRAPAEAPSGQTFPLGLVVQEVGNAANSGRDDVTVVVNAITGVLVGAFDHATNRTLRNAISLGGEDNCVGDPTGSCIGEPGGLGQTFVDDQFDRAGLFRVLASNPGSSPVRYQVEAFWDKSAGGFTDNGNCEVTGRIENPFGGITVPGVATTPGGQNIPLLSNPQPDGVPDGWRFTYGAGAGDQAATSPDTLPASRNAAPPLESDVPYYRQRGNQASTGFSGYVQLNTTENPLIVQPGQTVPIYFQVGVIQGADACPNNRLAANTPAGSTNSANPASYNDPFSPKAQLAIRVTNLDQVQERQTLILPPAVKSPAGEFVGKGHYSGRTSNVAVEPGIGQELVEPVSEGRPVIFDVIAVNKGNEVDDVIVGVTGAAGWTHSLSVNRTVPGGKLCDLPTAAGTIVCRGLGVYDEVHLQVIAVPGPGVRVGDRDPITVTVDSGDSPGLSRSLGLVARAAGTFDHDVESLGATTRTVSPGRTVSFPFVVHNDGTADDTYRISLIRGDVGAWGAVIAASGPVFVPAGHDLASFLTAHAPATAAPGTTDVFRLQVESVGSLAKRTIEFSPVVQPATALDVSGKDGQDVLIPRRGVDTTVNVTAVQLSGTPVTSMTFTVDPTSLPPGWSIDRVTASVAAPQDSSGKPTATAAFKVRAPLDAIGTSRAILHVEALAGTVRGATDITLNLASTFGINLTALDNGTAVIAPGGSAIYNLTLQNAGLGRDTVALTSTAPPAGWTITFNPPTAELGPLETIDVEAKIEAPTTAKPADVAAVVVFATSQSSPTEIDSVPLRAQVGFNALRIERVDAVVPKGAPQETLVWVLNVTNTGTLPDEVRMSGVIDTAGLRPLVNYTLEPSRLALDPNQTVQVRAAMTLGEAVPSDVAVVATATGTSLLDEREEPAKGTLSLDGRVLPFTALDVNSDSRREYAVDRDGDAGNGLEEFRANTRPGGRPLAPANLTRFLTEDALASFQRDVTLEDGTTVRVTTVTVDGDGDGKADHFLDADLDDQPDYYWDPDANKASRIEFRKDVNGDQVPETFVDATGDGSIDAVYDLTRGTFTKVIQLDVDGDGKLDYIVDKDGDGQVDADETVLYTRTGSLLIVQKVDVDGDGKLDQVFDTDGDGNPDYFVPAGSTVSVPIVLRDVNGDGTMDWTFDGDDDGRRESYYDPVTGEAHVIDATGHFLDALKKYWYIGALFALVLVLFVALVAVTRR